MENALWILVVLVGLGGLGLSTTLDKIIKMQRRISDQLDGLQYKPVPIVSDRGIRDAIEDQTATLRQSLVASNLLAEKVLANLISLDARSDSIERGVSDVRQAMVDLNTALDRLEDRMWPPAED